MEKSVLLSSTPVPPYESNPQYAAPPPAGYSQHAPQPVIQQDSYQIHQATGPQGQHPQPNLSPQYQPQEGYQQQGVASPHGDVKQEGYFTPIQQQPIGQQQQPIGQQQQPIGQQQQPIGGQQQQPFVQQQQQPLQPQQSQYRVGVPLSNLQDTAAPVDCPQCGTRAMTNISFQSGNTTHMWALGACLIFFLGCIPYLITATKDVTHKCSHCGVTLAKFHRSGRTVVIAHS